MVSLEIDSLTGLVVMTTLPVKGDVLKWAREFRGLREQQAADRLGISLSELRGYETEKIKVTIGAFENFSSKYRLPQATLFRLTRPKEPPQPKDFRTIEGRKPDVVANRQQGSILGYSVPRVH
jgi:transcriptional regulator with XRE-family HTH domain